MGAIVLLRGLFRGQFHWGDFIASMERAFPDRKIYPMDIPGAGLLHAQPSPTSIEDMVVSLRLQLAAEGETESVNILAVSMGGMIALKWAELYPDEVGSIACINTSAAGYSPFWQRLRPSCYVRLLKALFADAYQREQLIWSIVANRPADEVVIRYWAEMAVRYPMKLSNFFRQLWAAMNFRASQPQCQLLFVSSDLDAMVSSKASRAMAQQWGCEWVINRVDGHDIPLDNPDWVCELLNRWWGITPTDD